MSIKYSMTKLFDATPSRVSGVGVSTLTSRTCFSNEDAQNHELRFDIFNNCDSTGTSLHGRRCGAWGPEDQIRTMLEH
jgi:hypothetical protein